MPCKASGEVAPADFGAVVGRISFFVNAGLRFITEICKMRAFTELWDEITAERYGVQRSQAPAVPLRRAGQLAGPHRAAAREQRLSHPDRDAGGDAVASDARARAVQLPAWNEALGLPRPWDQQWSLRMQQILAYETDLLEYGDIFDGSKVVRRKVDELKAAAKDELARIEAMGGAVAAIDYMKQRLVESNTERVRRIEAGEQIVVGVNRWTETEASPLSAGEGAVAGDRSRRSRPSRSSGWRPGAPRAMPRRVKRRAGRTRARREGGPQHHGAVDRLRQGRRHHRRMGHDAARACSASTARRPASRRRGGVRATPTSTTCAPRSSACRARLGRRIKLLVGKPGLDGHSNGAEQIAVRARDCGMEVVYEGIRLTPAQIVRAAIDEAVHVVGLSILSGSHVPLVAEVMQRLRKEGLDDVPVVVGGIIPPEDAATLEGLGVAAVYTPKNFQLNAIMRDIVRLLDRPAKAA